MQYQKVRNLYRYARNNGATFYDERQFIQLFNSMFPGPTATHKKEAYIKQARANEKEGKRIARKLARKVLKEAEKQAELKAIEHRKAIEQAENEAWGQALRKSIKETEKRCNITIPEINGAFRFDSITFNNTSTHTEGQLYKAKKKFKRSRKSRRVRFVMPRVDNVAYSSDPTLTKTPTEASFEDPKSTAVEDMKHTVIEDVENIVVEKDSEPVEEILASEPSMWITPTPKIISASEPSVLTTTPTVSNPLTSLWMPTHPPNYSLQIRVLIPISPPLRPSQLPS